MLRLGDPNIRDKQAWTPHRPERPAKSEGGVKFELVSEYEPCGDQPHAIAELVKGVEAHERDQVLLGVTGSGKTFTMAQVIARTQRPALILAPNKTLAAQLYGEFKSFFPNNAVEYFVSYYDYYQPEAYVPRSDTYIEKESSVNEQIDRMRHAATRALLERDDVIIVASVSCIYGIGSVETYTAMTFGVTLLEKLEQRQLIADLVTLHTAACRPISSRGAFRVRGDTVDVFPAHYEDRAWRVSFFGDEVEADFRIRSAHRQKDRRSRIREGIRQLALCDAAPDVLQSVKGIKDELRGRLDELNCVGRVVEAQRLEQRTPLRSRNDGGDRGLRRHRELFALLTGRKPGEPPPTLFEYLPDNALVFADESHVSVPQIGAMYKATSAARRRWPNMAFACPPASTTARCASRNGTRCARKRCVSRHPRQMELEQTGGVFVEQVIRPTGLIDPPVEIRPARAQVDDLLTEARAIAQTGYRTLVTVLTKRMAEDLTEYLHENGVRVRYMHSDIDTIERIEIIRDLRLGAFDALVGINLLREGLDIPECGLVAILDADKEGFLRSETSLIQTIGRAARNVDGKVILYADKITGSMQRAIDETNRRRKSKRLTTPSTASPRRRSSAASPIFWARSTSRITSPSTPAAS